MAARFKIIILDKPDPLADPSVYRYALWADVAAARQAFYANPAAASAWKDADPVLDVAQLKSGAVVERVSTLRVQAGATIPQIQAFLQQRWTDFQAEVSGSTAWARYGSTWDGTTWVAGGA